MRILDVYDGQKVTELGTSALEEVWVSRPCLCFCVLDRSVSKRERDTEQPVHQRTQNQQQVTAEPVESPLPGRTQRPFCCTGQGSLVGARACASVGSTPPPGSAWSPLNGLYISGFGRKRNVGLGHRSVPESAQ